MVNDCQTAYFFAQSAKLAGHLVDNAAASGVSGQIIRTFWLYGLHLCYVLRGHQLKLMRRLLAGFQPPGSEPIYSLVRGQILGQPGITEDIAGTGVSQENWRSRSFGLYSYQ